MKNLIAELGTRAEKVWVEGRIICIAFSDGREVRFPAANSRRLAKATKTDLARVELICGGTGLHWETLDEDLSVQGIIEGRFGG